jgi:hypothetical protein
VRVTQGGVSVVARIREPVTKLRSMKRALILLGVLFLLGIGRLIYEIKDSIYWLGTIGESLHRELGFKYGSPYVNGEEVLIVAEIVPGGVMESAGLRVGDKPYNMSMVEFYKKLWHGRCGVVTVEVVNVYDNPNLSQKRMLQIAIPCIVE